MQWKAPVSDYLPVFDTPYNPSAGHNATVPDILSHSTGLAPLLYGILGKNDFILTRYKDVVHISSRLPCCALLRSKWQITIGSTLSQLVSWTKKAKARGPIVCTRSYIVWILLAQTSTHPSMTTSPAHILSSVMGVLSNAPCQRSREGTHLMTPVKSGHA
jgi:hypothetical protein